MDRKIMLGRMRKSPQFIVGSILVFILLIVALTSKYIAPCDPNAVNTAIRLQPPGFVDENGVKYLLGTDQQGRDILSRLLVGSTASIFISIVATAVVTVVGTALGVWAGYKGGIIDNIVMRGTEVTMAVPTLTLGIVIVAVFYSPQQVLSAVARDACAFPVAFAPCKVHSCFARFMCHQLPVASPSLCDGVAKQQKFQFTSFQ